MNPLDQNIERAEVALSNWAAIPVLGIVPGVLKVLMGAVEMAVGTIFTVIALLFALCNKTARDLAIYSLGHSGNGVKNIFIGSFEAIPLVGTVMFLCGCCFKATRGAILASAGALEGAADGAKAGVAMGNDSTVFLSALTGASLGAFFGGINAAIK